MLLLQKLSGSKIGESTALAKDGYLQSVTYQARIAWGCKDAHVKSNYYLEQSKNLRRMPVWAELSIAEEGVQLAHHSGDKISLLCLHFSRACQDQCRDSHWLGEDGTHGFKWALHFRRCIISCFECNINSEIQITDRIWKQLLVFKQQQLPIPESFKHCLDAFLVSLY